MAYEARKNTDNQNPSSNLTPEEQQRKQASKKATKVVAKGAATYFGGKAGGEVANQVLKTKAGEKLLNKGAEILDKNPAFSKVAEVADKAGITDAVDKGIDMFNSSGGKAGGVTKKGPSSLSSASSNKKSLMNSMTEQALSSNSQSQESSNDEPINETPDFSGKIEIPIGVKIVLFLFLPFFFIILSILTIVTISSSNEETKSDIYVIAGNDENSIYNYYYKKDENKLGYLEKINKVRNEFSSNQQNFNSAAVAATFQVIKKYNSNIKNKNITESEIRYVADKLNYSSQEELKNILINTIFPTMVPGKNTITYNKMASEVLISIKTFYKETGREETYGGCSSSGSCNYDIDGFYINGKGNISKKMQISNLHMRLMQSGYANGHHYGGEFGKPLENEELVPFEKYILGVAYQEIGPTAPDEAIKAQMVAARSYILARPIDMGGWRKYIQENDKWIIQTASSTQDQVYCDPDKGCSSTDGQWGQIHSGLSHTGFQRKPMPADSKLRNLASQTAGEVLTNEQGNIIYTGYTSIEQEQFVALANQGKDYKQILLQVYNQGRRASGAKNIKKMSCNNGPGSSACATTTEEFANWKQYIGPWKTTPMGNSGKTVSDIGCLATSISMLVAKSKVPTTNIQGQFNPGTFVSALNQRNAFDANGSLYWNKVTEVIPNFKYKGLIRVSNQSQSEKVQTLKNLLNQGYYVTAEVKGSTGQHWVAVDTINNDKIIMMDPASYDKEMWIKYIPNNTSTYGYFEKS